MVVESNFEADHYTLYCLKVGLMLIFKDSLIPINLQAVESLKKNNPKIYDSLWSGVFWKRALLYSYNWWS